MQFSKRKKVYSILSLSLCNIWHNVALHWRSQILKQLSRGFYQQIIDFSFQEGPRLVHFPLQLHWCLVLVTVTATAWEASPNADWGGKVLEYETNLELRKKIRERKEAVFYSTSFSYTVLVHLFLTPSDPIDWSDPYLRGAWLPNQVYLIRKYTRPHWGERSCWAENYSMTHHTEFLHKGKA